MSQTTTLHQNLVYEVVTDPIPGKINSILASPIFSLPFNSSESTYENSEQTRQMQVQSFEWTKPVSSNNVRGLKSLDIVVSLKYRWKVKTDRKNTGQSRKTPWNAGLIRNKMDLHWGENDEMESEKKRLVEGGSCISGQGHFAWFFLHTSFQQ